VSNLRLLTRHLYEILMNRGAIEICGNDLEQNAIIFAPHKDDETLACGGTILKKQRVGAQIALVFMTDGSHSHSHLISADELGRIRTSEAISASRMLGIGDDNVAFLEYREGLLNKSYYSAVNQVKKTLSLYQPDEVFIPHRREPNMSTSDHKVTNRIVLSALKSNKSTVVVYEYPIWLWHHPPWVRTPIGRGTFNALKQSIISGSSLIMDFNCFVQIGDVLKQKRAILAQYKSQMTRLMPTPRWKTLGDFSNGEFLERFFQKREIFYRYSCRNGRICSIF
jgi:LmbE family N-acetylglucosaminyl deacetylase